MNVEDSAIVIAVVQAVKSLLPDKVSGVVTIIVAGAVGFGLAYVRSSDLLQGVFNGLVGAGVITTATKFRK